MSLPEEPQAEERYLVRWRGISMLHCSWETRRGLEKLLEYYIEETDVSVSAFRALMGKLDDIPVAPSGWSPLDFMTEEELAGAEPRRVIAARLTSEAEQLCVDANMDVSPVSLLECLVRQQNEEEGSFAASEVFDYFEYLTVWDGSRAASSTTWETRDDISNDDLLHAFMRRQVPAHLMERRPRDVAQYQRLRARRAASKPSRKSPSRRSSPARLSSSSSSKPSSKSPSRRSSPARSSSSSASSRGQVAMSDGDEMAAAAVGPVSGAASAATPDMATEDENEFVDADLKPAAPPMKNDAGLPLLAHPYELPKLAPTPSFIR